NNPAVYILSTSIYAPTPSSSLNRSRSHIELIVPSPHGHPCYMTVVPASEKSPNQAGGLSVDSSAPKLIHDVQGPLPFQSHPGVSHRSALLSFAAAQRILLDYSGRKRIFRVLPDLR